MRTADTLAGYLELLKNWDPVPKRRKEILNSAIARLRVGEEMRVAAQTLIDNPGCGDPDCCETAIANDKARRALAVILAQEDPPDVT